MKTLIVVDYQQDFASPNGSLYVEDGEMLNGPITGLIRNPFFDRVIATKDLHPANHCSFENHGGTWPSHCVVSTFGADFHFDMYGNDQIFIEFIIHKGRNKEVDSYSAFYDNDKKHYTGLGELVKGSDIYICGLALDYCVKFTAIDALEFSDNVFIISDAVKAVEKDPDKVRCLYAYLLGKGVQSILTEDIA